MRSFPPRMTARLHGRAAAVTVALAIPLLAAPRAGAQVNQPTGEAMPQATSQAEIDVVLSRGFPADAVTLAGLFKYRMEMLDPIKDAHTTPGTFSPQCGFTGELVLRGGACTVGFGWYNVTPGATTPPPANQIYQLVPPDPRQASMCMDNDFCPLATMTTTQAPQHSWVSTPFTADNIRQDPNYKGGLIGFAMIGDMSTRCKQTKFSQAELNTKNAQGMPWVTTLVYQSTVDPNGYYLAFEDLPVTTASWKGDGTGGGYNDGDFNDFVYFVRGLNCDGGGKSCDTGMPGVCADGTTECHGAGDIVCRPNTPSSTEVCDGLDNDCDGVVDQGTPCPNSGQVCDKGVCVNKCNDSEFPCPVGLVCDNGYCKDNRCLNVDCPVGQICVAGACQGGCEGVVCPKGQTCRVGRCVDPCAGVTCDGGGVCENGACLPRCTCRECGPGLTCSPDGTCRETGCEQMMCDRPAFVCTAGNCLDACKGVTCPVNQECKSGECVDKPAVAGTGGMAGVKLDAGATGGFTGGTGSGGSSGGTPDAGAGAGGDGGVPERAGVSTCSCSTPGPNAGAWTLACLAAAGLWLSRRRRQRR